MAPDHIPPVLVDVEAQLKDIVQNFYNLIVQSFDHQGNPTQDAMKREIQSLVQNFLKLTQTAPDVYVDIPPEVTAYVETSRNPVIFNREFVETVQRMNQMLKGRTEAYRMLQEQLAANIMSAMPQLQGDVTAILEATDGRISTAR